MFDNSDSKFNNFLKILPIFILIFLISNFIFNAGYFCALGVKYMSLLALSDYYEGTAPYFIVCLFLFGAIFSIFNEDFLISVEFFPRSILNFLSTTINLPFQILINKVLLIVVRIKTFKNLNFSEKKLYTKIKKQSENSTKHSKDLFVLANLQLVKFLLGLAIIFSPVFLFWSKIYPLNKYLFILVSSVYVFFILLLSFAKKLNKMAIFVMFYIIFLFLFGHWMLYKNCEDKYTILKTTTNNEYSLIRPINKGVFVKGKDRDVLFLKWENVQQITRHGK